MDDLTKATVSISLTNPAPSSGCKVYLKIEPVEGTGGHSHDGNRKAHTGTLNLDSNFVLFKGGETKASVKYTSGEVAGTENIIAELVDNNGNVKSTRSISVDIKVDGLSPLISTLNVLSCGGTPLHLAGNNNYGTSDTLNAVYTAVGNYANEYHALYLASDISLAVIDMSLPDGGLFDIYGDWNTPHELHRVGKSVDFSKYYVDRCDTSITPIDVIFYNPDGSELMTTNRIDDKLDRMFSSLKGIVCIRKEKKIGKIHYECIK